MVSDKTDIQLLPITDIRQMILVKTKIQIYLLLILNKTDVQYLPVVGITPKKHTIFTYY